MERRNFLKLLWLAAGATALGVGGKLLIDTFSDNEQSPDGQEWWKELVINEQSPLLDHLTPSERTAQIAVLQRLYKNCSVASFANSRLYKDDGHDLQHKRYHRYNDVIDQKYDDHIPNRRINRKRMRAWFKRMLKETCVYKWEKMSHLDMVLRQCDDFGVPYDVVFLAIAESYWTSTARSNVAWWYWQFTKSTGRAYGIVTKKADLRSDPIISTKGAMRHLIDNRQRIQKWDKTLSESDAWKFSMWMYNGSPKLVKRWFKASSHKADVYSSHLMADDKPKVNEPENANYVPRILAIKQAVFDLIGQIGMSDVEPTKKIPADILYEQFLDVRDSLPVDDQKKMLEAIKKQYTSHLNDKVIDKKYYDGALQVIDEEIGKIDNAVQKEEDREKETDEPGIFVYENMSADNRFKVYSYIVKQGGTKGGVKKRFREQIDAKADYDKIIITDADGGTIIGDTLIKWEMIFVKYRIKDGFVYVNNSSDGKYMVYKYTVQKHGTPSMIKRKFEQEVNFSNKGKRRVIVTDKKGQAYKDDHRFSAQDTVYVKLAK